MHELFSIHILTHTQKQKEEEEKKKIEIFFENWSKIKRNKNFRANTHIN
jgi:hypothetical protein